MFRMFLKDAHHQESTAPFIYADGAKRIRRALLLFVNFPRGRTEKIWDMTLVVLSVLSTGSGETLSVARISLSTSRPRWCASLWLGMLISLYKSAMNSGQQRPSSCWSYCSPRTTSRAFSLRRRRNNFRWESMTNSKPSSQYISKLFDLPRFERSVSVVALDINMVIWQSFLNAI